MYITKTFTAHQLFDMAWETPILLLAKEIGVSDVGLSKACRKVGVALPARGHWAKPKAKRPRKPKPPATNEAIKFRVLDPTLMAHSSTLVPIPATDRISVQVPHELIDPHPLVRKWLTGVRKAKVSDGYLALEDVGILTAKISRAQVDRCAILYDTLLKEGEALGFAWSVGPRGTHVEVAGEKMAMSIVERLERYDLPRPTPRALKPGQPWAPDYSVINAPRYGWRATGELTIQFEAETSRAVQRTWRDTLKTGLLEIKLGQVLEGLPKIAHSVKAARLIREEQAREWQRQKRAEQERVALEARTAHLRSRLIENVTAWERAEKISAFIDATIQATPNDEQSQMDLAVWVTWTRAQLDLLDPLALNSKAVIGMSPQVQSQPYSYGLVRNEEDDWWG
jgi:hypothetical protein